MIVFDFRLLSTVASTRITPELQQYVQKLVNSFGVSLEQSNSGGTLSQEALSKRAQIAAQDPTFQRLKAQFSGDFELRYYPTKYSMDQVVLCTHIVAHLVPSVSTASLPN